MVLPVFSGQEVHKEYSKCGTSRDGQFACRGGAGRAVLCGLLQSGKRKDQAQNGSTRCG